MTGRNNSFARAFLNSTRAHADIKGSACQGVLIPLGRCWRCAQCGDVIEERKGWPFVISRPGRRGHLVIKSPDRGRKPW
jgi:hypothetical protein